MHPVVAISVSLVAALGCGGEAVVSTGSSSSSTSTASSGAASSSTSGMGGAGGIAGVGGAGGLSGGGGAGGAVEPAITLEPSSLEFFDLPIGSIRLAVAGQDIASNTCVSLIWMLTQTLNEPLCSTDDVATWPYVVVTPASQAPCNQWDYQGNVEVKQATGCVSFKQMGQSLTAEVDMTVEVSGALLSGVVVVNNTP